jgi:hypothetical protein
MLEWLAANPPPFEHVTMTEPPMAMPDEFKIRGDPVTAYRRYYKRKFDEGIAAYVRMPERQPAFLY